MEVTGKWSENENKTLNEELKLKRLKLNKIKKEVEVYKVGMSWADSSMLGLLNRSGIFIFLGFGILAFLKSIFPEIDN